MFFVQLRIFSYFGLKTAFGKGCFPDSQIRISHQQLKYGSLGRKSSQKRKMLHKETKYYPLIQKSAETSPCEIRSLLDYDRGQCAESIYLDEKLSNNSGIGTDVSEITKSHPKDDDDIKFSID